MITDTAERIGKAIGCALSLASMLLVAALLVAAIRRLWNAGGAS
jgi:hypothetical protein